MGKEKIGASINLPIPKVKKTVIQNTTLMGELSKQWLSQSSYCAHRQLNGDGNIQLTFKFGKIETSMIINGLQNEGNKAEDLKNALIKKKLLSKGEDISSLMIYKDYLWYDFKESTNTFRSGDKLMITIKQKCQAIKKAIKHFA